MRRRTVSGQMWWNNETVDVLDETICHVKSKTVAYRIRLVDSLDDFEFEIWQEGLTQLKEQA